VAVDVIFPCLDEAAALPWVLERRPARYRPIVVDNGSTDDSSKIAYRCGATVVFEPRRGFGAACHAGLAAATAEIVCFCDVTHHWMRASFRRSLARCSRARRILFWVVADPPRAAPGRCITAQGKRAASEAIRWIKRHIAREIYNLIRPPQPTAAAPTGTPLAA
jgi:hypothetical protein